VVKVQAKIDKQIAMSLKAWHFAFMPLIQTPIPLTHYFIVGSASASLTYQIKKMQQKITTVKKWQIVLMSGASIIRWSAMTGISIVLVLGMLSCQKDKQGPNPKVFNAQKFRQIIANQLAVTGGSPARGYAIVVNQGGVWVDTFSFGWAYRNATGGGYANMSVKQEINVASVSKTITAIGAMQLIKKNGLTIKSKIGEWLPAYWNARQSIKDLTFEELLTHSSGISESNTSWDSLKATVVRGLDNPAKPFDVYANMNFALFRAIIPFMVNKNVAIVKENSMVPGNVAGFESWLSQQYINYMQENVFGPIGISEATCSPTINTALGFNENLGGNVDGVVSMNPGEWSHLCGGGGYYLSAMELARFMAYLSHSYTILDKDWRALMDNKLLGWDNEDSPITDMGQAYGKDGALYQDLNNNNSVGTNEPGLQTLIMKFPRGIELSLVITSIPGGWRGLSSIATNAYNNSWEAN
jgi:D-alanyl-D-alanine carboxypeptidase